MDSRMCRKEKAKSQYQGGGNCGRCWRTYQRSVVKVLRRLGAVNAPLVRMMMVKIINVFTALSAPQVEDKNLFIFL